MQEVEFGMRRVFLAFPVQGREIISRLAVGGHDRFPRIGALVQEINAEDTALLVRVAPEDENSSERAHRGGGCSVGLLTLAAADRTASLALWRHRTADRAQVGSIAG